MNVIANSHSLSPLIQTHTEVIERGSIGIERTSIMPKYTKVQRREVQHLPELRFLPPDPFFGSLALGDVHRDTHELYEVSGCAQDGMAHGLHPLDRSVRQQNSKLYVVIRLLLNRTFDCSLPRVSILRVHPLQPFFPPWHP